MTAMEKRRARRFELALPVTLMSAGEKESPLTVQSRDISSNGILLECDEELRLGTTLELMVTLPKEITQAAPVRLRCLGRVVRVDRKPQKRIGVAVTIDRYEFMRLQNGKRKVS